MVDIAVSIVCYKNDKEVIEFAQKLLKQNCIERIQLIVTCNKTNNQEKLESALLSILPNTQIFNPNCNLGYLHGCMYGLNHSGRDYQYFMICNTDIEFMSKDFIERAIENINDNIWVVGPNIVVKESRIHQNPYILIRPRYIKMLLWKIIFSNYYLFKLYYGFRKKMRKTHKANHNMYSRMIYAVHGSCFIVNGDCIDVLNRYEDNIFMYGEELFIAEIIAREKKKIFYDSSIKIIHNENQATGIVLNRRKQSWFKQSYIYLYNTFFK